MTFSISKALVLFGAALSISACSTISAGNGNAGAVASAPLAFIQPQQVRQTVAAQALGPDAFPISADFGQKLRVPGIYKLGSNGTLHELCQNDFREQTALLAITVEESISTDVIYDRLRANRGYFRLGGLELATPYSKTKVDGYKTLTAISPTSSLIEQYIIANLGPNCPDVLKANRPYIIVTAVANAERAYTVSRNYLGGVVDFSLGPFGGSAGVDNDEVIEGPRTRVTFGVKGVFVPAEGPAADAN